MRRPVPILSSSAALLLCLVGAAAAMYVVLVRVPALAGTKLDLLLGTLQGVAVGLLFAIHARGDVPQRVLIGVDESVAGRDIARWADAHQAQPSAARVRLADAGMQLIQRIAHVRESVLAALNRPLQVLFRQFGELREHVVHAGVADRVETIGRSGHRGEPDFVKSQILCQVSEDLANVSNLRR